MKISTDLQQKAQNALINDPRTKDFAIEVLDNNGVITIKGHVPSRKLINTAQTIVEEVPGVAGLINVLEVMDGEKGKKSNLLQFFRNFFKS
jgi:osmotically-inducible protein OsmY